MTDRRQYCGFVHPFRVFAVSIILEDKWLFELSYPGEALPFRVLDAHITKFTDPSLSVFLPRGPLAVLTLYIYLDVTISGSELNKNSFHQAQPHIPELAVLDGRHGTASSQPNSWRCTSSHSTPTAERWGQPLTSGRSHFTSSHTSVCVLQVRPAAAHAQHADNWEDMPQPLGGFPVPGRMQDPHYINEDHRGMVNVVHHPGPLGVSHFRLWYRLPNNTSC